MKATSVVGVILIGLALLLVGLNFVLPNWAANDSNEYSATPLPTLGSLSRFAESPEDAVANGETPGSGHVLHEPPHHRRKVRHIAHAKLLHKKTASIVAQTLSPLPAPTLVPSTPEPSIQVIEGNSVSSKDHESTTMVTIEQPNTIRRKTQPAKKTQPIHKALTNSDLSRIRELRMEAQRDAIRRTAVGIAEHSAPGTKVQSADIEDLQKGLYRVVLVTHNPHGTVVESMKFQSNDRGGLTSLDQHIISTTNSDPFVNDPLTR